MKEGHNNFQGGFVKSASSGTVILKGESAENKSTQQSWPTFMLQRFQCQQSLFSYAINCLNRLPVEFLMCYKFHVCFPQVDSTQAHCVRPCPVISTGLGRTSTKENPSMFSSLQLYALLAYCDNICLLSFSSQWNLAITFCAVRRWHCARGISSLYLLKK